MMTTEDRAEFDQMLTDAWAGSSRVATVASELRRLLADAEQAQRDWAKDVLADALETGLQKLAKDWRKKQAPTKTGPVSLTAGVVQAGVHVQLELVDCNREQLQRKLVERKRHLESASRNAKLLRSLLAVYDKHPRCKTLAGALKAEGITLTEVLAA